MHVSACMPSVLAESSGLKLFSMTRNKKAWLPFDFHVCFSTFVEKGKVRLPLNFVQLSHVTSQIFIVSLLVLLYVVTYWLGRSQV